jgi:hypothetical protein
MRSYTLTAVVFLTCSSFILKFTAKRSLLDNTTSIAAVSSKKILDFNVRRFSGEKVFLSWHTEGDLKQMVYEVLRKHKQLSQFVSLGVVQPKEDGNGGDYSFVDVNNYSDSSYYCLKKTTSDSVVFYSITKGVEGVGKNR